MDDCYSIILSYASIRTLCNASSTCKNLYKIVQHIFSTKLISVAVTIINPGNGTISNRLNPSCWVVLCGDPIMPTGLSLSHIPTTYSYYHMTIKTFIDCQPNSREYHTEGILLEKYKTWQGFIYPCTDVGKTIGYNNYIICDNSINYRIVDSESSGFLESISVMIKCDRSFIDVYKCPQCEPKQIILPKLDDLIVVNTYGIICEKCATTRIIE